MALPAVASVAANALGPVIGAVGSWFSGKQSADFAERSYKHRYRWMVNDLQKAGLNPMLAVQNSPGSVAQPDFENIGEGALRGFSAQQQGRLLAEQFQTQKALTNKTMAEADSIDIKNTIARADPLYQGALKAYDYKTGVQGPSAAAAARWEADLAVVKNQAEKLAADTAVARMNEAIQKGQLTLQEVQIQYAPTLAKIEASYRDAMAKAAAAGVPAAQADAEFWESAGVFGKVASFLRNMIPGK